MQLAASNWLSNNYVIKIVVPEKLRLSIQLTVTNDEHHVQTFLVVSGVTEGVRLNVEYVLIFELRPTT